MNRPVLRRLVLSLAGISCLWGAISAGQVQAVRREAVTVDASARGVQLLTTALELAQAEDWPRVTETLAELERLPAAELIEVEPRRVLSAAWAARVLAAQLPANITPSQRLRTEAVAREAFALAQTLTDEAALAEIWRRYPASAAAGEALNLQAELCWRTNQLDAAAALWNLLQPTGPPPPLDAAAPCRITTTTLSAVDLAARRCLLERFSGDAVAAEALRRQFERDHADAEGWLAGRRGVLREILNAELGAQTAVDDESHGGRAGVGRLLWRLPLREALPRGRGSQQPLLSAWRPPPVLPVVSGERLYWAESNTICGARLSDGQPLWPSGNQQRPHVLWDEPQADRYPYEYPYAGVLRREVTVSGDRLWALVGPPFSSVASRESRPVETQLVCLDVGAQEGKLLWSRRPEDSLPGGWRWSGSIGTDGERLYLPARCSRPAPAIGVACLSAADGTPLWFRHVAGLLREPPATLHLVTSDQVTLAYGRVYLAGDWGGVACLEGSTGNIEWLRRDEPLPGPPSRSFAGDMAAGPAALCHRGMIYTVQHDEHSLTALDAWTGALLWRQTLPGRVRQLAGARHGLLYAAGDQVWGVEARTGAVRWRFGFDDVEGAIAGDILLDGEHLYACTPEELWQLDALTGEPLRQLPLWGVYGTQGGHVVAAQGELLVVSPDEITAWER